jgi:hypothetical protein
MTDQEVAKPKKLRREAWSLFHRLWSSTGEGRGVCSLCKRNYSKDDWRKLQQILNELIGSE